MPVFKRRVFAAAVLALTVALTIVLSGGRALRAERDDIARVFTEGADGKGLSIAGDLRARAGALSDLAAILERADADAALASSAGEIARALNETESVAEAARLNAELEVAANDIISALSRVSLAEGDNGEVRALINEIESRGRVIKNDRTYDERADAFNARLKTFPANAVAPLAGVKPLERFE